MATRRFDFKFHCTKDADIIRRLDAQENKQQYIRQLIATDIMADSLRGAFRISDQEPDQDPGELKEQARIDFYNKHCPAVNEPDPDVDPCSGCLYRVYKDDYSDSFICTIESAWENYWNHECKTKLSSVYGRMLKDPFKEDVINNMLEDKNDSC